jgi:hypothetical protein
MGASPYVGEALGMYQVIAIVALLVAVSSRFGATDPDAAPVDEAGDHHEVRVDFPIAERSGWDVGERPASIGGGDG